MVQSELGVSRINSHEVPTQPPVPCEHDPCWNACRVYGCGAKNGAFLACRRSVCTGVRGRGAVGGAVASPTAGKARLRTAVGGAVAPVPDSQEVPANAAGCVGKAAALTGLRSAAVPGVVLCPVRCSFCGTTSAPHWVVNTAAPDGPCLVQICHPLAGREWLAAVARARAVGKVHLSARLSAWCHGNVDTPSRWRATPPLPGCQATPSCPPWWGHTSPERKRLL
jgi:hypothetical protein